MGRKERDGSLIRKDIDVEDYTLHLLFVRLPVAHEGSSLISWILYSWYFIFQVLLLNHAFLQG